ncbi:carboxypeptidase-like regulatory domain-containing protein [Paucibacter sp. O1-1]|nr:carboxypeptidase-like regulatory domain-containing protein [Paucibacter sp. O1-1]MDA3829937.1 carboxypeptidase-like regulatory domain-containing protein [Paucibacter sp. O1-1]
MMSTWMRCWAKGLLAPMVLALAACSGGDDAAEPTNTRHAGLAGHAQLGKVLASADSAPVAEATVSVGTRSTRSAADGSYTLSEVPAAARAVLRVSAAGHVDALVPTVVTAGQTVTAHARLLREATAQSFESANAAVLAGRQRRKGRAARRQPGERRHRRRGERHGDSHRHGA